MQINVEVKLRSFDITVQRKFTGTKQHVSGLSQA